MSLLRVIIVVLLTTLPPWGLSAPADGETRDCQADLAWLRVARPEVTSGLPRLPAPRAGRVPRTVQVWRQLARVRRCALARALRDAAG